MILLNWESQELAIFKVLLQWSGNQDVQHPILLKCQSPINQIRTSVKTDFQLLGKLQNEMQAKCKVVKNHPFGGETY